MKHGGAILCLLNEAALIQVIQEIPYNFKMAAKDSGVEET